MPDDAAAPGWAVVTGTRLPAGVLAAYGLPAFALSIPTIPLLLLIPTHYAETLGVGLAAVGMALTVARVVDMVTDPLAGALSDRLHGRWARFGRRKPLILIGGLIAGVGMVEVFLPPDGAGWRHLLIWSVVLYLGWTLVTVPYTALGAELSGDYGERARITSVREGLMLVGVLVAAGVPAVLGPGDGPGSGRTVADASTFRIIAWITLGSGAAAVAALMVMVPDRAVTGGTRLHLDRAGIASLLANGPARRLLAAWFVNGLANGLPSALFQLYLTRALLADAEQQGMLIGLYFLSGVLAMPVWLWLGRHHDKHRLWVAAMAVACVAFATVPLLSAGDVIGFAVVCVVTGVSLGADLMLPPAMQADVVDYDRLRSGQDRAGIYFALWSMATKLALAAAVGIGFPLLDLAGMETGPEAAGRPVEGPARVALVGLYAAVPVVLKLAAMWLVWGHRITRRRHGMIRRRLAQRAARAGMSGGWA